MKLPDLDRLQLDANFDVKIKQEFGVKVLIVKLKKVTVKLQLVSVDRVKKENINALINQYQELKQPSIIFTPHLNAVLANQLHASNVQFVDLSGNVFIHTSPLYVFIKGEKPIKKTFAFSSPFGVAGIKVIFALLSNPGLEDKPYRAIAKLSNISLGSIDTLMRNLSYQNYLLQVNYLAKVKDSKRKLTKKQELLNRWCISYSERLQSKLILARLSCEDKQWWKEAELNPKMAVWGGEVAAAKLTKYLKPQIISIYAETALPELQAKYALRKSDHGEILIYKKFWNFQSEVDPRLAPIMLIYAELINSGDSRNIETARIIYEKYLAKIIE